MHRVFAGLAVLATGSALECGEQIDCVASSDDPSLIQLAGISNKVKQPADVGPPAGSFAKASKPFLTPKDGLLTQGEQGKLIITVDGVEQTAYLPGAPTLDDGKTVKYEPPYRYYLMNAPSTDYSNPALYWQPPNGGWMGKTFTVDFDFGEDGAGCGCNINFYLVKMPADSAGKDNDWYCDAQCFPGLGCCSEFDMNEGNAMTQQITNHACTGDYAQHPDWACNKWGDPELKTHPSDFSPGDGHTINSNKPFSWKQVFDGGEGKEFTFTTIISQEGRDVTLRMGPGSSQLNSMMGDIMEGMTFVTGYWFASDMNWLDKEECGDGPEHCNQHPVYLKNWRVDTNGGPSPPPPPPGPPTPPSPSPPSPPPSPPSANGKCCWGPQCSNCNGADDWCSQSMENCWQCTGAFCKA